jgi:ubiquinone/menaquinone biosynthesis C-methylase UbiE
MSAIASQWSFEQYRTRVLPGMYAEVIFPGSPSYGEALQLQAARFGSTVHVPTGSGEAGEAYVAITDYAPHNTIPIIVRREMDPRSRDTSAAPGDLLGTARLELPGTTLIEAAMLLRPGSVPAQALADGCATEIGGFATPLELDRATLLDVVDTLVAAILTVAEQHGLEWFWLFPRVGFMSLMWASIPGVLPPYRFTLSPDVLGWNEGNERLEQLRALRPRGMQDFPEMYHISRQQMREDLEHRLALRPAREQLRPVMRERLFGAMREASRLLPQHAPAASAQVGPSWSQRPLVMVPEEGEAHLRHAPGYGETRGQRAPMGHETVGVNGQNTRAVAFTGTSSEFDAEYLQTVIRAGGSTTAAYKETSFRLLDLHPGMRVLDVGCGTGDDLPNLAALVGLSGRVIGLERDPQLVRAARAHIESAPAVNCQVFLGNGEHLSFPAGTFDRVRTDRALQHFAQPERALQEFWRVLRPDGIAAIVEPDWKAMVLWPSGGSDNPNDDSALQQVLTWHQQQLPHGLIGRRLPGLLRAMGPDAWDHVQIEVHSFELHDWSTANAILQVTEVVDALIEEQPALRHDLEQWLMRLQLADARHSFFATIPLFFATAHRAAKYA